METDLYNYQCKNIMTYLTYYSNVRQRAENYYYFIKKYKKSTSEYLKSINNLLKSYTPSFEKVENDNNKININEKNIKNEIKVDLSPLDKITSEIYKEFQEQINAQNFFLKNIGISLDNFKVLLKQTKLEVENQRTKYLNLKDKFIESISSFKNENEELIKDLSNLEDKLIVFYYINKKLINYNGKNNKKEKEEDIDIQIKEIKEKENTFIKQENNKLNNFITFNNEIEACNQQIKNNTILLIKIFKLSVNSFSRYFFNFFNLNQDNNTTNTININKDNKKDDLSEYESSINKNLKSINNNTIKTSLIQTTIKKYVPIILKTETKNVIQYIFDILQKEGYNIDINDMVLNAKDILYIIQKLKEFNLVDKKNYDIEKEKNKIIISEIVEIMFKYKNEDGNDEKILEEESNKLFKYLEIDGGYRTHFLIALGCKRTNTNVKLSSKLFDILSKIFSFIADMIFKDKDYETENNLIILSQTFYKLENEEKIYLYVPIKSHKLVQTEEYWIEYIKYQISSDVKSKFLFDTQLQENVEFNQNHLDQSNNEIIFAQIISANQSMQNFELDKNKIINIIKTLIGFYPKLTPESQKQLLNFIEE